MKQKLIILVIFLLGFGASQLFVFLGSRFIPSRTSRPVEISKEATSSSLIAVGDRDNESAAVGRVIDGDTVELADGRKLRYIGIDTPELVHPQKPVECFAREAKEENEKLVEGKTVKLEKDISETDKYGRLLRYVYIGELMVNEYLIRQGFAHSSTYPPDVKYSQQFLEAERQARENNRGLWAGCPTTNGSGSDLGKPQGQTPSDTAEASCVIKGNISSNGEKIYHTPGCGSYDKTVIDETKGEKWFCSEEEALSSGWRKAKNCL